MIYAFGDYELDTDRYELRFKKNPVRIEPKAFDLLTYLLQHHGRFVSKEDLHEHLWPDQFVSDSSLTYCIAVCHKAIGDTGRKHQSRGRCFGRR